MRRLNDVVHQYIVDDQPVYVEHHHYYPSTTGSTQTFHTTTADTWAGTSTTERMR